MGVYIKGVEMPQGEEMLCINVYPDGKVCIDLDLHCKRVATAIPVPLHGRMHDGVTCPNNGAIDCNPTCKRCLQVWINRPLDSDRYVIEKCMDAISDIPSATIYGYNIDHLMLIASILKEKNIPPENVADMVKDVGRVIEYAIDSFNAHIEKTLKEQMSLPEPPKEE